MPLTPADIAALSRLLDEAQDLDAGAREAWLAAQASFLPAAQSHLIDSLREMLAERDRMTLSGPLATLPRLAEAEAAGPPVSLEGQRIGPYRVLREIGRGGMGSVWLAERADGAFDRQVALKLPRLTWGEGLAARMAREQRIGARLEHPAIARLYDAGVDELGRPYIAMEYIDGVAIDAFLQQRGLDVTATLRLMLPVIRAVAYAHGRLVVHRDLKPSNVIVGADGQVHLLDFGIATLLQDSAEHATQDRLTLEQGLALTPAYASPEQIRGEAVTVQSDVYGLGILLYELLAGQLPHRVQRPGMAALQAALLIGDPDPPSRKAASQERARALRGDVDAIVGKALKVELNERYSSAEALAEDIERCLRGEPVLARPDSALYRWKKALRRNWRAVGAAAVVSVAVIGGSAVALVQSQRASRAAERQKLVVDYVSDLFRLNPATSSAPAGMVGDAFLRNSAELASQRFAGEPAMQAQLYGVLAQLFLELGATAEAADYAQRRVDSLVAARAEDPALFTALVQAARTKLEIDRQVAQAEADARRALALAGDHSSRQAEALSILARVLEARGKGQEAGDVIDQLDAVAARLDRAHLAVAWGHALRGVRLGIQNRLADSRTWLERGIRLARQVDGEDSLDAAEMQRDLGWQLMNNLEVRDALAELQAAYETYQRHGGAGAVNGAVVHAIDWSWLRIQGAVDHASARGAVEQAQAAIARLDAVPDRMRHRVGIERGIVAIAWGDFDEAWRWLPPNAERVLAKTDSPSTRIQLTQMMTALTLSRGDHEAAGQWIDQTVRVRAGMRGNADPWAIQDHLLRARNLSMAGRHDEARATLEPLTAVGTLPPGMAASVATSDELRVARARVLADAGRYEAAWQLVRERPASDAVPNGMDLDSPKQLHAELLCARGQHTEGRALFEADLAILAKDQYPHAPLLARLRAHAGLCALGAGDRKAALLMARQARESFTAQPVVSAYFKLPLQRLEAALGLKG